MPGVASIALALLVWAFTFSRRVPLSIVMNVGLCFEVVSSYGIAFAEYLEPGTSGHERLDRALVGGRVDAALYRGDSRPARARRCWRHWRR